VDIYALACLALTLLMGRQVFESDNLLDLVRKKLSFSLPARDRIGGGISPEMHAFLEAGMQATPADRLDSLDEVAGWAQPADPAWLRA
jgi:hypothetical protein